jgi:hypothetical protein
MSSMYYGAHSYLILRFSASTIDAHQFNTGKKIVLHHCITNAGKKFRRLSWSQIPERTVV